MHLMHAATTVWQGGRLSRVVCVTRVSYMLRRALKSARPRLTVSVCNLSPPPLSVMPDARDRPAHD
mgnify:CR=1 FL=1